jgi:hypothetical protein
MAPIAPQHPLTVPMEWEHQLNESKQSRYIPGFCSLGVAAVKLTFIDFPCSSELDASTSCTRDY